MIPYKLDYTIEEILKTGKFNARQILKALTGKSLAHAEAETVWRAVQDHKWLVSRRLERDIGLRAAAVDYLENFYRREYPVKNFKQPRTSVV